MSNFKKRVVKVVADIPPGQAMSYGEVAAASSSPRAAQAVGWIARSASTDDLPWHRVVRADGSLAPGFAWGGAAQQQSMLESEGIKFSNNHKISGWNCE